MRYNLLQAWRDGSLPKLMKARPPLPDEKNRKPDDVVMQSSFEFTHSPKIYFVKSFEQYAPLFYYKDLPSLFLTEQEKLILEQAKNEFSNDKNFYNGNHILITGLQFDDEENIIYIQAVRVDYAFMRALQLKKFPADSDLYRLEIYRTGALVPFITKDNHTFFIRRDDRFKLVSAAAGFLECDDENSTLINLVERTAIREACDEILNDENNQSRVEYNLPAVKSISIRVAEGAMPAIEFIVPMRTHCDHQYLQHILQTNQAKDAKEHVSGDHFVVSLDSRDRERALTFLSQNQPGKFLYAPMLISSAILANREGSRCSGNDFDSQDFIPRGLPYTRTQVLSLSAFSALWRIPKQIAPPVEQYQIEQPTDQRRLTKT